MADKDRYLQVLRELMASVHVPAYMGWTECQKSIDTMADLVIKFPLDCLDQVKDDLSRNPSAKWPSPGVMISMITDKMQSGDPIKAAKAKAAKLKSAFENINGWGYDQIMATKQGRAAKRDGKPYTFLTKVRLGTIVTSSLDFPEGVAPRGQ